VSGYGRARPRRRCPVPVYSGRDAEQTAADFARRAEALAPVLGFCGWCGEVVDEAAGKLHAPDCGVSESRRRVSEDRAEFAESYAVDAAAESVE
jgi:hypothetical protein